MPTYTALSTLLLYLLLVTTGGVACRPDRSPNIKVQFVDSRVGWIVGPRLLQTTDGGRTWTELRREGWGVFDSEYIGYGHRSIQFIDSKTGVQLAGNTLAKTSDGGRTWPEHLTIQRHVKQDVPPQSVFFSSPETGWVVGEYVYGTRDGGRNWVSLSPTPIGNNQRQRTLRIAPSYANYMPAIWFFNPKKGLMARLDGEIYATTDGGLTWAKTWTLERSITDIFFINAQVGWIVGAQGLLARTSDGGQTWAYVSVPTNADLTSIFFINGLAGCAVGYEAIILCTKNGGNNWNKARITGLLTPSPLASVSFANELHGWAVGGNSDPMFPSLTSPSSVIVTTEDGGESWRVVEP